MTKDTFNSDAASNPILVKTPDFPVTNTANKIRAVMSQDGVKAIVLPPPVPDVRKEHQTLLADIWDQPCALFDVRALIRTDLEQGTAEPVKVVAPSLSINFQQRAFLSSYAYTFARCTRIAGHAAPRIVAIKLTTDLKDYSENRNESPFLAAAFMQAGLGWKDRSGQIHAVERDSAIFSTSGVICATPRANPHMPPLYLTATLYQ